MSNEILYETLLIFKNTPYKLKCNLNLADTKKRLHILTSKDNAAVELDNGSLMSLNFNNRIEAYFAASPIKEEK